MSNEKDLTFNGSPAVETVKLRGVTYSLALDVDGLRRDLAAQECTSIDAQNRAIEDVMNTTLEHFQALEPGEGFVHSHLLKITAIEPQVTDHQADMWKLFRDAGLLWYVNTFLHVFGWSVVLAFEGDKLISAFPERVQYRGFSPLDQKRGFEQISWYMNTYGGILNQEVSDDVDGVRRNDWQLQEQQQNDVSNSIPDEAL